MILEVLWLSNHVKKKVILVEKIIEVCQQLYNPTFVNQLELHKQASSEQQSETKQQKYETNNKNAKNVQNIIHDYETSHQDISNEQKIQDQQFENSILKGKNRNFSPCSVSFFTQNKDNQVQIEKNLSQLRLEQFNKTHKPLNRQSFLQNKASFLEKKNDHPENNKSQQSIQTLHKDSEISLRKANSYNLENVDPSNEKQEAKNNTFQFNQETIRQPDDLYFESPQKKSSENMSSRLNSSKKDPEDKLTIAEISNENHPLKHPSPMQNFPQKQRSKTTIQKKIKKTSYEIIDYNNRIIEETNEHSDDGQNLPFDQANNSLADLHQFEKKSLVGKLTNYNRQSSISHLLENQSLKSMLKAREDDEIAELKRQLRDEKNQMNKLKATFEQQSELMNMQLREASDRESGLKKNYLTVLQCLKNKQNDADTSIDFTRGSKLGDVFNVHADVSSVALLEMELQEEQSINRTAKERIKQLVGDNAHLQSNLDQLQEILNKQKVQLQSQDALLLKNEEDLVSLRQNKLQFEKQLRLQSDRRLESMSKMENKEAALLKKQFEIFKQDSQRQAEFQANEQRQKEKKLNKKLIEYQGEIKRLNDLLQAEEKKYHLKEISYLELEKRIIYHQSQITEMNKEHETKATKDFLRIEQLQNQVHTYTEFIQKMYGHATGNPFHSVVLNSTNGNDLSFNSQNNSNVASFYNANPRNEESKNVTSVLGDKTYEKEIQFKNEISVQTELSSDFFEILTRDPWFFDFLEKQPSLNSYISLLEDISCSISGKTLTKQKKNNQGQKLKELLPAKVSNKTKQITAAKSSKNKKSLGEQSKELAIGKIKSDLSPILQQNRKTARQPSRDQERIFDDSGCTNKICNGLRNHISDLRNKLSKKIIEFNDLKQQSLLELQQSQQEIKKLYDRLQFKSQKTTPKTTPNRSVKNSNFIKESEKRQTKINKISTINLLDDKGNLINHTDSNLNFKNTSKSEFSSIEKKSQSSIESFRTANSQLPNKPIDDGYKTNRQSEHQEMPTRKSNPYKKEFSEFNLNISKIQQVTGRITPNKLNQADSIRLQSIFGEELQQEEFDMYMQMSLKNTGQDQTIQSRNIGKSYQTNPQPDLSCNQPFENKSELLKLDLGKLFLTRNLKSIDQSARSKIYHGTVPSQTSSIIFPISPTYSNQSGKPKVDQSKGFFNLMEVMKNNGCCAPTTFVIEDSSRNNNIEIKKNKSQEARTQVSIIKNKPINQQENNQNLQQLLSDGDIIPGNELLSNDSNYSPVNPFLMDESNNKTSSKVKDSLLQKRDMKNLSKPKRTSRLGSHQSYESPDESNLLYNFDEPIGMNQTTTLDNDKKVKISDSNKKLQGLPENYIGKGKVSLLNIAAAEIIKDRPKQKGSIIKKPKGQQSYTARQIGNLVESLADENTLGTFIYSANNLRNSNLQEHMQKK